jgi:hypothetical protein
MLDLQTPKTVLGESFGRQIQFPRGMTSYLLGTGLAALLIVATVFLVGHYASQNCLDGQGVLTEKDARACAR